jgi:hypothetical protein
VIGDAGDPEYGDPSKSHRPDLGPFTFDVRTRTVTRIHDGCPSTTFTTWFARGTIVLGCSTDQLLDVETSEPKPSPFPRGAMQIDVREDLRIAVMMLDWQFVRIRLADGEREEVVTPPEDLGRCQWPKLSPDGAHLSYECLHDSDSDPRAVIAVDGSPIVLPKNVRATSHLAHHWVGNNSLLVVNDEDALAYLVEVPTRKVIATKRLLTAVER